MPERSSTVVANVVIAIALVVVAASSAAAQTSTGLIRPWSDKAFFNVSFGSQTQSRTQTQGGSLALHDETASWETSMGVDSSSIVDIGGGMRVWRNVGVALGFSRYSDSASATIFATIPDLVFYDTLHEDSEGLSSLRHRERAVHLSAVFAMPIAIPKIGDLDVMVLAGPSFYRLTKGLAAVEIVEGSTEIASVSVVEIGRRGTGGHIALDLTYRIRQLRSLLRAADVGVGVFVRHSSASIDAAEVSEGSIDVGGLNYGVGFRVRF